MGWYTQKRNEQRCVNYQSINLKPPSDPTELKARANSTASAGDVLVLSKDENGSITSRPMYTQEQYQSGQVTELNMKSLEIRLSMASCGGMGYGVDSIAETADELAATYVAYRAHIDKYEPEETKAAELEKLDTLIHSD